MRTKYLFLILIGLGALSCAPENPLDRRAPIARAPSPPTSTKPAQTLPYTASELRKARIHWGTYCFTCHGIKGEGDGLGGINLDPLPRDLSNPEWQDSVDDDYILKVIRDGGASVGMSGNMSPNPMYRNQTGILRALVALVRSCRDKK